MQNAYDKIIIVENKTKKILVCVFIALAIVSVIFMFVLNSDNNAATNNENNSTNISSEIPEANDTTSEITSEMAVEQKFKCSLDSFNKLEIVFNKEYEYDDDDTDVPSLTIKVLNGNDILMSKTVDVREIPNQHRLYVEASGNITGFKNKELVLRITNEANNDTGCSLMMQDNSKTNFKFGNNKINGTICFALTNN